MHGLSSRQLAGIVASMILNGGDQCMKKWISSNREHFLA
jgi:hypothetical protein